MNMTLVEDIEPPLSMDRPEDHRLTLFIASSSIIILSLILIIGVVSCFILCNEERELMLDLQVDTPTREAYEQALRELQTQEGKNNTKKKDRGNTPSGPTAISSLVTATSSAMLQGAGRHLLSILEEEENASQMQSYMKATQAQEQAKEDEFSNLIGLDHAAEDTFRQIQEQLQLLANGETPENLSESEANSRSSSFRTSRFRQSLRSKAQGPFRYGSFKKKSFSEWTQKSRDSFKKQREKLFAREMATAAEGRDAVPAIAVQAIDVTPLAGSAPAADQQDPRNPPKAACVVNLENEPAAAAAARGMNAPSQRRPAMPVERGAPDGIVLASRDTSRAAAAGCPNPRVKTISSSLCSYGKQSSSAASSGAHRLCTHCFDRIHEHNPTSRRFLSSRELTVQERKRFFESMHAQ